MKMWNALLTMVVVTELMIVIGGAIFLHAFTTVIKGRNVTPAIPFIILMAIGSLFIPELPSIDNPNSIWIFLWQVASFSIWFFVSGIAALGILAKFGKKPNSSLASVWPWR